MLIGYDRSLLEVGVEKEIYACFKKFPMMAISGATGWGKTAFEKYLLGTIATEEPDAKITLCDFKREDFRYLEDCKRVFTFTDCSKGFDEYLKEFTLRQNGDSNERCLHILVFDEWASYLNFTSLTSGNKSADIEKSKMSNLLMTGRAFSCHVIVTQQIFYAKHFEGARDNFSLVVNFGNPSKEVVGMWGFDKERLMHAENIGEGHILMNDTQIPFQSPIIRDFDKLDEVIRKVIS